MGITCFVRHGKIGTFDAQHDMMYDGDNWRPNSFVSKALRSLPGLAVGFFALSSRNDWAIENTGSYSLACPNWENGALEATNLSSNLSI